MNAVGIALVWCVVQVTLLGVLCGAWYLIVRRFRPAAAAPVALTGLVTVVLLSALALAPWPRWQFGDGGRRSVGASPPHADASISGSGETPGDSQQPTVEQDVRGDSLSRVAGWWRSVLGELSPGQPIAPESPWRWPAALAALLLIGMAAGAAWLLLGLLAVRRQRARSRPVEDPALLELAGLLRAELGCRRPVEVRQSSDLATAATVGWRRPVILLPCQWTTWTAAQRRAVLAHEMAHVCRNDFLAVLCGQLGLVLHFYHPLLHWLMGRLRLEQELAADADAASVAGGRRQYLMTIADLALKQEARPMLWPARSFLPTQTTFLRRIAMLRNSRVSFDRRSPIARGLAVGAVVACGLLIAGLRSPGSREEAPLQAAEKPAAERQSDRGAAELTGIDLTHAPDNAIFIAAFRPAAIFRMPGMGEYGKLLGEASGLPTPLTELEQVTVALLSVPKDRAAPDDVLTIYQMTRANDFARELASMRGAEKIEYHGRVYLKNPPEGPPETRPRFQRTLLRLNDRTLVTALTDEAMRKFIDAKLGLPPFLDAKQWKALEGDHAVMAIDASKYALLVPNPTTSDGTFQSLFSPLWKNARWWACGVRAGDRLRAYGVAVTPSPQDADKVKKTVEAGLTLGINLAGAARAAKSEEKSPSQAFNAWALEAAESLLASIRARSEGNLVRVEGSVGMDTVRKTLPPLAAAREASGRSQSVYHLKLIGLAMHHYHDRYKSFPPAVLYGPDGRTPYSWRVALLPFLEQEALYKHYRFDEPWDGPNNRRLAETRVPVYHQADEMARSANASYFALVGRGTAFEERKLMGLLLDDDGGAVRISAAGIPMREIVDGTSNTLLIVEAKRDIPWSKPEDIAYDPKKPIPTLGGCFEDGFNVLLCDGSVHFLPKGLAETTLRAMITRNGREAVDWRKEVHKR